MSILTTLSQQIECTFNDHPHRFFTEHDIHSELNLIATELLKNKNTLYKRTSDGLIVNRIHHEYPTPFRCYMKGTDFRVVTEDEFKQKRFRARRGWIDFVILNPEFISSNTLAVVSGKRYRILLKNLEVQQYPALDLAVEVVYYPVFDEKPHFGIMRKKVDSTIQDYKKMIAVMDFTYPNGVSFCKQAAMMFFSNTRYKTELQKMIRTILMNEKVSFFSIIH